MDIEGRGKSSSYDVGHAPASTPLRPQASEEKAAAATRVADDSDAAPTSCTMTSAQYGAPSLPGILADWVDAAQDARNELGSPSPARRPCTRSDARCRRCAGTDTPRERASAPHGCRVAGPRFPEMPSLDAPIGRCADAVVAVLPSGRALGWQDQRALSDVVAEHATHSDLIALRSILEGKAQHPLTSRFQQFSPSTRKLLVRILCDRELVARAEARQAAQRQARRAKARANASTTAAPPASMATPPIGSTRDDVPPGDASAGQVSGAMPDREGEPLPHRAEMEHAFGRSFSDVKAHKGMAVELAPMGAQAVTVGNEVMFADETPSPALVAHERRTWRRTSRPAHR